LPRSVARFTSAWTPSRPFSCRSIRAAQPVQVIPSIARQGRAGLLDQHAQHCVLDAPPEQRAERTHKLMAAVGRLVGRG
jgi:hypothetical protein